MRILLARVAPLYGRNGGMEMVEARMADAMIHRGHQVGIVSYDTTEGIPYFPLNKDVHLLNLNDFLKNSHPLDSFRFKIMRELIRPWNKQLALHWRNKGRYAYFKDAIPSMLDQFQPDVIISFDAESSAVFLGTVKHFSVPLITMFHFSINEAVNWEDAQEIKALRESACVQVLLNDDLVNLKERIPQVQAVCIPNVVPSYPIVANLKRKKSVYTIIDVARLTQNQKRPHLLIEAFALLSDKFPQWRVEFWGSEPDGKKEYTRSLQKLIESKKLDDKVFLRGNTNDVLSKYVESDIIAFPSAYEGFGLALAEGMSAGLPGVGFRNCMGVNEIIADGKTGYLVEDGVEEFAKGLSRLMENQELRIKMGKAAHEAMKRYSPQIIWDKWERVLSLAVEGKKIIL